MSTRRSQRLPPVHPGDVLRELLDQAGMTVNALALALRVPPNRISGIIKWQRVITADTAPRLARYFGTSPQLWLNLQAKYELSAAEDLLGWAAGLSARFSRATQPELAPPAAPERYTAGPWLLL